MTKYMVIHPGSNCWAVSHYEADGVPDSTIVDLFGTHTLPSAFTLKMPLENVKNFLVDRNPDVTVITQSV